MSHTLSHITKRKSAKIRKIHAPEELGDEPVRPEVPVLCINIKTLAGYLPSIQLDAEATVADLADAVLSSDPNAYRNCRPVFIRALADGGSEELEDESRQLSSFGLQCDMEEQLVLIVKDLSDFNQRLNDILRDFQFNVDYDDDSILSLQRDCRYATSCTVETGWNRVDSSKTDFLEQVLMSLKAVTYLNMSDNHLNSAWIPKVYSMHCLTHLILNRCRLGDRKADELAKPLATLTSLTHLELHHNEICDVGGRALYPAIARLELLRYLDLGYNRLCDQPTDKEATYRELNNALSKLPALTHLNLNRSYTSVESWGLLAPALSKLTSLTSLNLSYQRIGQTGFRFLTQALRNTKSLTELIAIAVYCPEDGHLESNSFSSENPAKRVKCAKNQSFVPALALELGWLTHLVIPENRFGDNGVANFAPKLPKFSKLQQLNLGKNEIGDNGCKALASALSQMSMLTELSLYENFIGDNGTSALASALLQLSNMTDLKLSGNEIGDDGAGALASALPRLTNLTDLDVSHNKIGEDGCCALALALANVPSLMTFSIARNANRSGGTGCRELVHVLMSLKLQCLISWDTKHDDSKNCCSCKKLQIALPVQHS